MQKSHEFFKTSYKLLALNLQLKFSIFGGQSLIILQSQIRAYGWEKILKLINVQRTFIWIPRVAKFTKQIL